MTYDVRFWFSLLRKGPTMCGSLSGSGRMKLLLALMLTGTLATPAAGQPKPPKTLKGHTREVFSVAFSPDGKTVASGSADQSIKLWDVAGGKNTATLKGHTDFVQSVAFSPDGKTLASGSRDKTVNLWDVASGKTTATLKGHTDRVWSVAFSPDGKTLACYRT